LPRRQPSGASGTIAVDSLLVAAERVLVAQDLAGLTTNRVAEVAGVGVATLYRYFPNKESLVRALHERYLAQYVAAIQQTIATNPNDSFSTLATRIADACVDVLEAQAPVHRALRLMRSSADLHTLIDEVLRRQVDFATEALRGMSLASADEARTLAFVIVHTVDGLGNALANGNERIDTRLAARTLATMIADHFARRV